ncbi:MAG: MFS transporter [Saprospiraceae bacterium]|nr:MFS transporter [Saprospiraceae bacterium]
MTVSEMFAMPFMTNYAVSKPSENRRGQYMALYSMAYGFAHILAPLGGLYIADVYGFRTLYLMLMLLSILVTIGFFSIRRSSIIA